jgi:hypothetical protein
MPQVAETAAIDGGTAVADRIVAGVTRPRF